MKNLVLAFLALAVDYFTRHPQSEECHITSDGRVFHNDGAAQSYAGTLKDNKIEPFKRTETMKPENDIDVIVEGEDQLGDGAPGADADTGNSDILKFDTVNGEYAAAVDLVEKYDLKAESRSKVNLFAAIAEYQTANANPQE